MFLTDIYNHDGEKEEEADQTLQVARKNLCAEFLFGKDKDAPCDVEAKKDIMVLIVAKGIGDLVVFVLVLVASDVLGVVASDDLGAGGNPRVHA